MTIKLVHRLALTLVLGALLPGSFALAQDRSGPPDRPDHDRAQKDFDRQMDNAREVTQREAQEKDHEAMHDPAHDGRIQVSKDVSIGGAIENGPSVNVKVHSAPDHPTRGD